MCSSKTRSAPAFLNLACSVLFLLLAPSLGATERGGVGASFRRGDVDASGSVEVADAAWLLEYLFRGGTRPTCIDAADSDDDGALSVSDALVILRFAFLDGAPLPEPYPQCGSDPTEDTLTCEDSSACSERRGLGLGGDDATPIEFDESVSSPIDDVLEVRRFSFSAAMGQRVFLHSLGGVNRNRLRWRLEDVWGRAVASANADRNLGPVALMGGDYTVRVSSDGSRTGHLDFRLVAPTVTESTLTLGETASGELLGPADEVRYEIDVPADGKVYFDFIASSNGSRLNWMLTDAAGRAVLPRTSALADAGPWTLAGGAYTLTLLGEGAFVGSYEFRMTSVVDERSSGTVGQTIADAIEMPGQTVFLDFSLAADTRLFLDVLAASDANRLNARIEDAAGRAIFGRTTSLVDTGPFSLPGGDYTLCLTAEGSQTPDYELVLLEVEDDFAAIALGDTVDSAIDSPGQSDTYAFSAASGQVIRLDFVSSSNPLRLNWSIVDSLGREVLRRTTSLSDVGPLTLVGGDYELVVTGEVGAIGDYEFSLVDDGTTTYSPTGTTIALGDEVHGQIDVADGSESYVFSAVAGDTILLDMLPGSGTFNWELLDPFGQSLARANATAASSSVLGPFQLAPGTWTIVIRGRTATATPSFDFKLWSIADTESTIALGDLVSGSFVDAPGALHRFDFTLATTQRVLLDRVGANSPGLRWRLDDALGGGILSSVSASTALSDRGPFDLVAGTYTLTLDPDNDDQPAYEFRVVGVEDSTESVALGEVVSVDFTGRAGATRTYTLSLTETREIFIDRIGATVGSLRWSFFDEQGIALFTNFTTSSGASSRGPFSLLPGTYSLVFDPDASAEPSGVEFRFLEAIDASEPLDFGVSVVGDIPSPGGTSSYTFTTRDGQTLLFDILSNSPNLVWSLFDAVGTPVFLNATANGSTRDQGPFSLVAGDWELVFDGLNRQTPSFEFVVDDLARDLSVVELVTTPGAIRTNDASRQVDILWTVRNGGGGPAIEGSWTDRIVISGDRELGNGDDLVVANTRIDGPLAPRSSYSRSATITIPPGDGNFVVFLVSDADDEVDETRGEANNIRRVQIGVLPEIPDNRGLVSFDQRDGSEFPVGSVVALSGRVTAVGGNAAVLYIVDSSASTRDLGFDADFDGDVDEDDDVDGDGRAGTILDAELGSVLEVDRLVSRNANTIHAFIFFALGATTLDISPRNESQVFWTPPGEDADGNGTPDFEEAVRSVQNGTPSIASLFTPVEIGNGQTLYNDAIGLAAEVLPSAGDVDQRVVVFLTDGEPTDAADEEIFRTLAEQEITFRGFQINSTQISARMRDLAASIDQVDGSNATARSVSTASDLLFEIVNAFKVVAVLVDGAPADRVDAAGRFFHLVTIEDVGPNTFEVEVIDASGGSFTDSITFVGVEPSEGDFEQLSDATTSLDVEYSRTTHDRFSSQTRFQARACNTADMPIDGPLLMVFERFEEPTVSLANPDGFTPTGKPYVLMLDQTVLPSLEPGACTPERSIVLENPGERRIDFDISWLALSNHPPYFTSVPQTVVRAGEALVYDAEARDPDGHAIAYSLEVGPAGLSVDVGSGLLRWTPQVSDGGSHAVRLVAEDGRGGRAVQSFFIEVRGDTANRAPQFTSLPDTHSASGARYEYRATASDADGDALSFSMLDGPGDLSVAANGVVTWDFPLPGDYTVALRVEDGRGGVADQRWLLTVGSRPTNPFAPTLSGTPAEIAVINTLYFYQPLATDPDGDPLGFLLETSPDGMNVHPATGRIEWVPEVADVGSHRVVLTVSDSRGGSSSQSWDIEVLDTVPNLPPVIESVPATITVVGELYEYQVVAADPDGQTGFDYELIAPPTGMQLDASGLLTWTPTATETVRVSLRASDPLGASASQVWDLRVVPVNRPPSIDSSALLDAVVGGTYRYDASATDPDNHVLTWSLDNAPEGMEVQRASGLITWTPTALQLGSAPVRVRVRDVLGGTDTQAFTVRVSEDDSGPEVEIVVSRTPGEVGREVSVCVRAADDVGVVERSLEIDGAPVELDEFDCAPFLPEVQGNVRFTATASDAAGNSGDALVDYAVVDLTPSDRPVVTLHSPTAGSVLSAPTEIVASITDDNLLVDWVVQIAREGSDEFRVIAQGEGEVLEDVVAHFDTTMLANDSWRVQIVGNDGAQTGGIEFGLSVSGDYKLGNFVVDFVDLTLPVAGIPIIITRRYDSLDTTTGDFGAGWSLGLPGRVVDTAAEPDFGSGLANLLGRQPFDFSTRVYVTRPDGERVGFTFRPVSTGGFTAFVFRPRFEPDPGVTDTLEAIEPAGNVFVFGGQANQGGVPYNPSKYRLTTREGVSYVIDEDEGLELIEDPLGNTITVTPGGLVSSVGVELVFERDAEGRIERIVEPVLDGGGPPGVLSYEYDGRGNLVAFRNQTDEVTRYFYENASFPNYLTRVEDPLDRPLLQTVYDDAGRLIALCGPGGNPATLAGCTELSSDAVGGTQTLTTSGGFRIDREFDERGQVVLERRWLDDAEFLETRRNYDEAGRLIEEIDPDGNRFLFTWDERGNLLTRTDGDGQITAFTYNDCDLVETQTDPLGNVTRKTYDENCNLRFVEDALGGIAETRYNARGQRTDFIDPAGNHWRFAYDGQGYPISMTDPLDRVTQFEFNRAGRVVWQIDRNGRRVDLEYDDAHRVTRETWDTTPPRVTEYFYDDAGRTSRVTDPDSTFSFTYWETGRLRSVDNVGTPGAPNVVITYGYDASGNIIEVSDTLGGRTAYEYDALNRLVGVRQQSDTPGAVNEKRVDIEYSGGGLPVEMRRYADLAGTMGVANTSFEYGCTGCAATLTGIRHQRASGALIHDIDFVRDATAAIVEMSDAEGVHTYSYDALRRLLAADHPAGAPQPDEAYTYDAAGNRLMSHQSSTHAYDAQQLALDDEFSYEYDEAGNLLGRTELSTGAETVFTYDYRNRVTSIVQLDAQGDEIARSHYVYNAAGFRIREETGGVAKHIFYDGQNPILELETPSGQVRRRLYSRTVDRVLAEEVDGATRWFLTDHIGTTRDVVDDAGRVLAHYAYDSFGRVLDGLESGSEGELLFTGRSFSDATGLGDYRRRLYDPGTGRFLQEDRLAPWQYAYANNSPLLFTDPTGETALIEYALFACDALAAIAFGQAVGNAVGPVFEAVAQGLAGEPVDADAVVQAFLEALLGVLKGPIGPCGLPIPC